MWKSAGAWFILRFSLLNFPVPVFYSPPEPGPKGLETFYIGLINRRQKNIKVFIWSLHFLTMCSTIFSFISNYLVK